MFPSSIGRTSGFHPEETSSTLVGSTNLKREFNIMNTEQNIVRVEEPEPKTRGVD